MKRCLLTFMQTGEPDSTLSYCDFCRSLLFLYKKSYVATNPELCVIQDGAELTDTFQMVIDNTWKQEKISETVYKYVQVCYLLPTNYKLIFPTSGRLPPFTSMHCCKRVWKLPYTRLRRSSSIAATSSTMACLSS